MRKLHPDLRPDRAAEDWVRALRTDIAETVTVRCRLITPMHGGGVRPGEVDMEMPIRASAVRGQLRFWWRLLHAAGLPPREGFSLERSLSGGIRKSGSCASLVTLRVKAGAVRANELVRKGDMGRVPPSLRTDSGAQRGLSFVARWVRIRRSAPVQPSE